MQHSWQCLIPAAHRWNPVLLPEAESDGMSTQKSTAGLSATDSVLIAALLAVRLLEGILRTVSLPLQPLWIFQLYYSCTYLLLGCLLYRCRSRLGRYNITWFGLGLILCTPILEPLLHWTCGEPLFRSPFNWTWGMVLNIPGICVVLMLASGLAVKHREVRLPGDRPAWLLVSIPAGLLFGSGLSVLYASFADSGEASMTFKLSIVPVILMGVSQLSKAAVMEEPVFRGFLWGLLAERGWPPAAILAGQAVLFLIAHLYHLIQFPPAFWIGIPLCGLLFGAVAWRTRSIAVCMLFHAAVNTAGWFAGLLLSAR